MSGQADWDAFPPASGDGWDPEPPADVSPLQTAGPPTALLAASLIAVVASAALLLTARDQPWGAGLAWILAGPVNVALIGLFLGQDNRRRAGSLYLDPGWTGPAYKVLLVVGMVLAVAASWFFADWMGRR